MVGSTYNCIHVPDASPAPGGSEGSKFKILIHCSSEPVPRSPPGRIITTLRLHHAPISPAVADAHARQRDLVVRQIVRVVLREVNLCV